MCHNTDSRDGVVGKTSNSSGRLCGQRGSQGHPPPKAGVGDPGLRHISRHTPRTALRGTTPEAKRQSGASRGSKASAKLRGPLPVAEWQVTARASQGKAEDAQGQYGGKGARSTPPSRGRASGNKGLVKFCPLPDTLAISKDALHIAQDPCCSLEGRLSCMIDQRTLLLSLSFSVVWHGAL